MLFSKSTDHAMADHDRHKGNYAVMALSVLVVIPHLFYLPLKLIVFCMLVWSLNLVMLICRRKLSVLIYLILVGFLAALVWLTRAQISLLNIWIVPFAMKPLETHTPSARQMFALLCYFAGIAFFFLEPDDAWLFYYAGCFVLITAFALGLDARGGRPDSGLFSKGDALKTACLLLVQAIPLVVFLFFAFPRLSAPFWQSRDPKAVSGLSSHIELDKLARLNMSEKQAFIAEFNREPPGPSDLYWRGPVFYFTDGMSWDTDHYRKKLMPENRIQHPGSLEGGSSKRQVSYEILQEQAPGRWLICLDLPVTGAGKIRLSEDYQLLPVNPRRPPATYRVTSFIRSKASLITMEIVSRAMQLPSDPERADKARQFGRRLKQTYKGRQGRDEKIIQHLLRYYAENPFYYTLNPGRYLNDPVDEFFFGARKGYCTHFASAMTIILRAAGVPARMITGFRGAERQPGENRLVVRQEHAHAWVEAWVKGRGWIRIDPVTVLPQGRIQDQDVRNMNNAIVRENRSRQTTTTPVQQQTGQSGKRRRAFSMNDMINQVQDVWQNQVKRYNFGRQQRLFKWTGTGMGRLMVLLSVAALGFYIFIVIGRALIPQKSRNQPVRALYCRMCEQLSQKGLPVNARDNPRVSLYKLKKQHRLDEQKLEQVFSTYEKLRYACNEFDATPAQVKLFSTRIRLLLLSFNYSE